MVLDMQRRFLESFAIEVLQADPHPIETLKRDMLKREKVEEVNQLPLDRLMELIHQLQERVEVPNDPIQQLKLAIQTMYQK